MSGGSNVQYGIVIDGADRMVLTDNVSKRVVSFHRPKSASPFDYARAHHLMDLLDEYGPNEGLVQFLETENLGWSVAHLDD